MNRLKTLGFVVLFFSTTSLLVQAQAPKQELRDELDALDELPPDDLNPTESAEPETSVQPEASTPAPLASEAPDDSALDDLPTAEDVEEKSTAEAKPETKNPEPEALDELPVEEGTAAVAAPEQSLTGTNLEAAGLLQSLDFKQLRDRVRLVVKANQSLDYARDNRPKRKQVIVELRNLGIAKSVLRRALDTGEFDGPVALVQAFESKAGSIPVVKVLFQLRQYVDPTITRSGNELYIDFPTAVGDQIFKDRAANQVILPETFLSPRDKVTFTGSRISLNTKEAALVDVINFISKASGRNFVISGEENRKVTLNVQNTPWDQVLTIVLMNAGMGYQKMGDVYRIAPTSVISSELQAAARALEEQMKLIPQETRLFTLSYAKATDLKLENFLTGSSTQGLRAGKTVVDSRTNSIAVTDYPEVIEKVERYIKRIDLQSPQVLIEGRIVEATENFTRSFNLNWGANPVGGVAEGRRLRGSFVNSGVDVVNTTAPNGLPLTVPSVSSKALGVGLRIARLGDFGAIAAAIGLAETEDETKIVATPKVLVENTKKAVISQGQTLYLPSLDPNEEGGAKRTSVEANTKLSVTPFVSADGFVFMELSLSRDTPSSSGTDGKDTRSIETQLLVENGKTVVLGGLYVNDQKKNETGWPGLRSLPLVGLLFQNNNTTTKNLTELLMFISPRILNADRAMIARTSDGTSSDAGNTSASAGPRMQSSPPEAL